MNYKRIDQCPDSGTTNYETIGYLFREFQIKNTTLRLFKDMNKISLGVSLLAIMLLMSCGGGSGSSRQLRVVDLPFDEVNNRKAYADLILKAIRTNRDIPLYAEFERGEVVVDKVKFNEIIGMYSSGIGGRTDWAFYDIQEERESYDNIKGFDYAWLDPEGRLGIQIYIEPVKTNGGFGLQRIEFRSRLEVMESISFPGGQIDNYKKLNYDWSKHWDKK